MITFKEYLEEGKKSDRLLGAALAGSALFAGYGAGKYYGVFGGTEKPDQAMSSQEIDAMTRDMSGNLRVTQSSSPQTQPQKSSQLTYHHDTIKQMVIKDEGIRTKPYRDTRGILTVGIGHNLQAPNSKETFNRAFGNEGASLHAHVSKGGSLTNDQATKLFDADYDHHLQKAIKLTPNLHEHPPEVQAAIVSGTYRGHWGGSPAARNLFNQGKYKEASKELLNNNEFRRENAKTKNRGVADRMLRDAKILHNYGVSVQGQ